LAPSGLQRPLLPLACLNHFGHWFSAAACKEYSMEILESPRPSWQKSLTRQILLKVCWLYCEYCVRVDFSTSTSIFPHTSSVGNWCDIRVSFELLPVLTCADSSIRPMLGGVLSHPANRWPDTLGRIVLFRNYPYFLPCLVAAMVPLSAFGFTSLFLKEVRSSLLYSKRTLICFWVDTTICCSA